MTEPNITDALRYAVEISQPRQTLHAGVLVSFDKAGNLTEYIGEATERSDELQAARLRRDIERTVAPPTSREVHDLHSMELLLETLAGGSEGVRIYCDAIMERVTAVLDDEGLRDQRITWEMASSLNPEWVELAEFAGQMHDQGKFAEWIESHAHLISVGDDNAFPSSSDMLTVAQTLVGTRTARYGSARYLHNGAMKVVWEEEDTATAGEKGELEIPRVILFRLPVVLGGRPWSVQAHLRYRVSKGEAQLGIVIPAQGKIRREEFAAITSTLPEGTIAGAAPPPVA